MTDNNTKAKPMYLVGSLPHEAPSERLEFHTTMHSAQNLGKAFQEIEGAAKAPPDQFSLEVKKKPDSPWQNWISIGRAGNSDVVLPHLSVSKIHARIRVEPSEDGSEPTKYWIEDAGSTLGTVVNQRVLQPKEELELKCGDAVIFGDVECLFVDSPG